MRVFQSRFSGRPSGVVIFEADAASNSLPQKSVSPCPSRLVGRRLGPRIYTKQLFEARLIICCESDLAVEPLRNSPDGSEAIKMPYAKSGSF